MLKYIKMQKVESLFIEGNINIVDNMPSDFSLDTSMLLLKDIMVMEEVIGDDATILEVRNLMLEYYSKKFDVNTKPSVCGSSVSNISNRTEIKHYIDNVIIHGIPIITGHKLLDISIDLLSLSMYLTLLFNRQDIPNVITTTLVITLSDNSNVKYSNLDNMLLENMVNSERFVQQYKSYVELLRSYARF